MQEGEAQQWSKMSRVCLVVQHRTAGYYTRVRYEQGNGLLALSASRGAHAFGSTRR